MHIVVVAVVIGVANGGLVVLLVWILLLIGCGSSVVVDLIPILIIDGLIFI